jgi:mono/diheme cytochrome c family protein
MLKSDKQQAANGKQLTANAGVEVREAVGRRRLSSALVLFAICCLLFAGACRRDMQDQPKMKPLRSTTFFKDGLSSRPPVEGTVPRGFLNADTEYFTGKKAGRTSGAPTSGPQPGTTSANATGAAAFPDDLEIFPLPVTDDLVKRGRERYEIFCSACHGFTGKGDGMIVRRGFRRAASFHDERLRAAPVGHFFDAITNGWGAMPSYAPQISVKDRWAIVAYVRALQISQEVQPAATPGAQAAPAASPSPQTGGTHQ